MKAVSWMIALTCFLLLVRCTPLGIIPTGSKEHKATILCFTGGGGHFDKSWKGGTYGRSKYYFTSQGIKMEALSFDFPKGRTAQVARTTESHFQVIQKKVNDLRRSGHKRIWLMGLSNGAISVWGAGASQIKGVEGLFAINPPSGAIGIERFPSGYINYRSINLLVDLDEITLPVMVMVHEKDGNVWPHLTEDFIKQLFSSSKRVEIVMFSGGRIGTSIEATRKTVEFQHGLRGLEKEFAQTAINFIDSNSDITEAEK